MFHVLMSTFNGEKYLEQQLASIFEQEDAGRLFLHVRDDGSKDATLSILERYREMGYPLNYYQGDNLGPAESFWRLLKETETDTGDYVAFADQDDIWRPDKLKRARRMLLEAEQEAADFPLVYCANVELVDEDQISLGNMHSQPPQVTLKAQFTCGIAPGCSMVMNAAMAKLLRQVDFPSMPMHDTMVLLTGFCVGKVVYDQTPALYYRQHGENAESMKGSSFWEKRRKMFVRWFGNADHSMDKVAAELLAAFAGGKYGELQEDVMKSLYLAAHYKQSVKNRWKLLMDREFSTFNKRALWSFRIRVLLGIA